MNPIVGEVSRPNFLAASPRQGLYYSITYNPYLRRLPPHNAKWDSAKWVLNGGYRGTLWGATREKISAGEKDRDTPATPVAGRVDAKKTL